ncbi:MAG TPA: hypothetical protein VFN09_08615 [Rhodanobacteraceae bacterium]|nr:hypothetical protein [Rhodanobacteraceae bacterium]
MTARSKPTVSTSKPVESPWLYAMLALLGTAGFFYVNLAAAFVDGLVGRLGYSHAQAGEVLSANIYGASVGGLIAVFLVRRWAWRPMMLGLLLALLVIELVCTQVASYTVLLPLRALNGLLGGAEVGIALALLARTRLPDRAFGALLVFQFTFGGFGSWLLPGVMEQHGTWVLFACLAAMDVAALVVAAMLRMPATTVDDQAHDASAGGNHAVWLLPLALLALFLFQAANMGLFAFIIPLGEASALTLPFISQTVGWTTWIGTLGAVLVIAFGTQLGRARPLLAAMLLTLVCIAGLYWSAHKGVFFASNAGSAITWSFVVPYLFGIVAWLDRSGRLATLAGFVSGLGLASGPLFAGWVAEEANFAPMISLSLVFFGAAMVAMLVAAARVDRMDKSLIQSEV